MWVVQSGNVHDEAWPTTGATLPRKRPFASLQVEGSKVLVPLIPIPPSKAGLGS